MISETWQKLVSSSHVEEIKQQAKKAGQRLADRHLHLAVTGLSRSGKTVFITSLVNQLLEARGDASLQFFAVARDKRLIGVRRESQPDVRAGRFSYEHNLSCLLASPSVWPASTDGISQIRLAIKYRPSQSLRKYLADDTTLTLDITDYPGEWLLDLPLLEMDFASWCKQSWQQCIQHSQSQGFQQALATLGLEEEADELMLAQLASDYRAYLADIRQQGYHLIQPGRFVLPGELEGAPVLQFFPVDPARFETELTIQDGSNLALLKQRFEHYKQKVVQPFYQQYFKGFDRQVVLVDCLTALNQGRHSVQDLQQTLDWLLASFHYGRSSWLKRLFSPRIDKLVFAATKADHITPDQQDNLVKLMESLIHQARQHIQYEGVETESTAIASVNCSAVESTDYQGQKLQVLRGNTSDGKQSLVYPGEVPSQCPPDLFWQQQGFNFPAFMPPAGSGKKALQHMRIDQLLEYLLGDKLL